MKNKFFPIILILGAFFLFSCSPTIKNTNNDNLAVNIQDEETPESYPITDEETPQAIETQETTVPEETSQPTQENPIQPVSACYHPYFPIADGASWTYAYPSGEGYTLKIEDMSENTFTLIQEMEIDDAVFTVDWFCSEDGLLNGTFALGDILSQDLDQEGSEIRLETLEWEGQTLPAADRMEVGYTWTSEYKLSGDLNIQGVITTAEVNVLITYIIGAIEEVTVPAGTFQNAIRVDSLGEIEMAMNLGETRLPSSTFDFEDSTWYVENVGMVKISDDYSGFSTGLELVDSSLLD